MFGGRSEKTDYAVGGIGVYTNSFQFGYNEYRSKSAVDIDNDIRLINNLIDNNNRYNNIEFYNVLSFNADNICSYFDSYTYVSSPKYCQ
jgi:hypothetical protein